MIKNFILIIATLALSTACTKKALSELAEAEDTGSNGGGSTGGGGGGGGSSGSLTGENYGIFPKIKSDGSGYEGYELYKKTTQSTTKGTVIKDLGEGKVFPFFKFVPGNTNTTMFFTKFDTSTGTELWKSDGTESGTTLVEDLGGAADSSYFVDNCSASESNNVPLDASMLTTAYLNSAILFTLTDCESTNYNGQVELWISDGTAAGTRPYREVLGLVDGDDGQGHNYKYSTNLVKQINNQYALVAINRNDETGGNVLPVVMYNHGYKLIIASATGQYKEVTVPDNTIFQQEVSYINVDGDDVFLKLATEFYTFRLTDSSPTLVASTDNPNFIQPTKYGTSTLLVYGKMMYHFDENSANQWKVWDATSRDFVVNSNIPSGAGMIKKAGNSYVYINDATKEISHCNATLTTCTALSANSQAVLLKSDKAVTVSIGLMIVQDKGSSICDFIVIRENGTIDSLSGLKTIVSDNNLVVDYCSAPVSDLSPRNIHYQGNYFSMTGVLDINTYEMMHNIFDQDFESVSSITAPGAGVNGRTMYHLLEDWQINWQNAAMANNVNQLILFVM